MRTVPDGGASGGKARMERCSRGRAAQLARGGVSGRPARMRGFGVCRPPRRGFSGEAHGGIGRWRAARRAGLPRRTRRQARPLPERRIQGLRLPGRPGHRGRRPRVAGSRRLRAGSCDASTDGGLTLQGGESPVTPPKRTAAGSRRMRGRDEIPGVATSAPEQAWRPTPEHSICKRVLYHMSMLNATP